MAYDQKCFDLATTFLDDHPDLKVPRDVATHRLAQAIQTLIEDEIEELVQSQPDVAADEEVAQVYADAGGVFGAEDRTTDGGML